jgi:hypothetical protein
MSLKTSLKNNNSKYLLFHCNGQDSGWKNIGAHCELIIAGFLTEPNSFEKMII